MQNKPLSEYGDLQSVHHMDKQYAAEAEAAEALLQEESGQRQHAHAFAPGSRCG